jgi:hypothetical protein
MHTVPRFSRKAENPWLGVVDIDLSVPGVDSRQGNPRPTPQLDKVLDRAYCDLH